MAVSVKSRCASATKFLLSSDARRQQAQCRQYQTQYSAGESHHTGLDQALREYCARGWRRVRGARRCRRRGP